jgi:hypothetical protein
MQLVNVAVEQAVGILTRNHVQKRNALNEALIGEIIVNAMRNGSMVTVRRGVEK